MHEIASFGRWLKLRRIALELTQAELGRLVGCAEITIRKIEADERRPSTQVAERLARSLELAPDEHASFLKAAQAEIGTIRMLQPRPIRAPIDVRGCVPVSPTPLIGRGHAVAVVRAYLQGGGVRLLTLTGPGGVGKTRLALQAAAELDMQFADGAWFVNLAPLRDPSLVVGTIAQALEIRERAGMPLSTSLAIHLRTREVLLVLDNFEQVIAAAPLIAELLAAAPGLSILATSRRALHLSGEQEFAVPPLELPPVGIDASGRMRGADTQLSEIIQPASYLEYASVELFVARARAVRHDFALTSENAPAVVEICAQLDGLPLAIELAAARSKLFPPKALLGRLDHRLNLLTAGAHDLPTRQRTLRDEITWSYDMLSANEQALFAQLAVFTGGWTLDAAQIVCAESTPLQQPAATSQLILDGLASLLDQSLLRHEEMHGQQRFIMLETIREYALEQLEASGEVTALRMRHASYFLALAERTEPELPGSRPAEWLKHLTAEWDNLRAALAWCLDDTLPREQGDNVLEQQRGDALVTVSLPHHRSRSEMGLRLAGALQRFWEIRGLASEGRAWLMSALACAPCETASQQLARAKALEAAARLAGMIGDNTTARECCEESLALYQAYGDKAGIARVLIHMGDMAWHSQDHAAQRALYQESLTLYCELEEPVGIARMLSALAGEALSRGDFVSATALYEESLALACALEDQVGIFWTRLGLGVVALYEGRYTRATALLEQSLTLARELEDTWPIANALIRLGHIALAQGDHKRAAALLEETLALVLADGQPPWISAAWAMQSLGAALCHQGEFDRAMALYRDALTIYHDGADRWGIIECLEGLAVTVCGQGKQTQQEAESVRHFTAAGRWLGAVATERASTGNPMLPAMREAIERASAAAGSKLGEATFVAAYAAGRALPLEQVIGEALGKDD